jgi:hypothetical protein
LQNNETTKGGFKMNSCTEHRQIDFNVIGLANNWWKIFHKLIEAKTIDEILDATGAREKRNRKLPAKIMMMLSIAMSIFTEESISDVFSTMMENIRYQHPDLDVDDEMPKKGLFARLDIDSVQLH